MRLIGRRNADKMTFPGYGLSLFEAASVMFIPQTRAADFIRVALALASA